MPLIITEPCKIGDKVRDPGYELTKEDMVGRNIGAMKRHGQVKWIDGPSGGRGRRRQADDDE